jgi:hypothetical protein
MVTDNRQFLRLNKSVDLLINDSVPGWTNNLSLGGISAFIKNDVPLFKELSLSLKLPSGNAVLIGQCLRLSKLEDELYNVAISFENLPKRVRSAMIDFINS